MKVAILSNVFKKESDFKEVEDDLMEFGNAVKAALESGGHETVFFDVNETTFEQLRNKIIRSRAHLPDLLEFQSLFPYSIRTESLQPACHKHRLKNQSIVRLLKNLNQGCMNLVCV